ncbi:MAG: hypothetical protein IKF72_14550 [Kiritimatiellae bacterium]|nr:hypothetical protein [Kiritimatiellia bacterium]
MRKAWNALPFAAIVAALSPCAGAAGVVRLASGNAACAVDTATARVLSFRIGGEETLWNDDPPQMDAPDWAHGGMPVCWPWFGVNADGAIHGTAWRGGFETQSASRTNLVLRLATAGAVLHFRAALSPDALEVALETRNAGTNELAFSAGLHPYFRVSERDDVLVHGADGLAFEDDPSCPSPTNGTWRGVIAVTNYLDRIFRVNASAEAAFRLSEPARRVSVEFSGADAVNVWNPGPEKLCPGTVPGDSWRRFVCIEPIVIGTGGTVSLPAGGTHLLRIRIIPSVGVPKEKEKTE